MTQSLIGKSTLSFLVFGPGKESKDYLSHRVPVKNLFEELDQSADFPEDIRVIPISNSLAEALADNVATRELDLMRKYDYTIILLISVGSISESSLYVTKADVAYKIRLYVPERYRKRSYLMTGPVKAFKDVHRHVYYFKNPKHLLEMIRELVTRMLVRYLS
jgi:hypothetical protein